MESRGKYWLLAWADACDVRTRDDAQRVLADSRALGVLQEYAHDAEKALEAAPVGSNVIVAGRGLDLSTFLSCPAPECRIRQVDELLRRAWLYFDSIVVDDSCAHIVKYHWKEKWRHEGLLSSLEIALYLRSLGAEHLIQYRSKPMIRRTAWASKAGKLGLAKAPEVLRHSITRLIETSKYRERPRPNGTLECTFSPADRTHTLTARLNSKTIQGVGKAKRRELAATWVEEYYGTQLVSDMDVSRRWRTPLASTNWLHQEVLVGCSATPEQVVFDLTLPILEGVDLSSLLALREGERDAFVRFRAALRGASQALLNAHGDLPSQVLATQLRNEYVEPELANIRSRLKSAESGMARKTAVSITLGGLATTCGILAGVPAPLAVAAGTAALIAGTAAAASKKIDEDSEVALSDMFFLWRAAGHGGSQHVSD